MATPYLPHVRNRVLFSEPSGDSARRLRSRRRGRSSPTRRLPTRRSGRRSSRRSGSRRSPPASPSSYANSSPRSDSTCAACLRLKRESRSLSRSSQFSFFYLQHPFSPYVATPFLPYVRNQILFQTHFLCRTPLDPLDSRMVGHVGRTCHAPLLLRTCHAPRVLSHFYRTSIALAARRLILFGMQLELHSFWHMQSQ